MTLYVVVAYIGPDTMLPLASAAAAGLGVLLMFWRYVVRLVRGLFRLVFRRHSAPAVTVTPGPELADTEPADTTSGQ